MKQTILLIALGITLVSTTFSYAELKAGVARRDITPPIGGLMYGYGARGMDVSTGVHDPLYAKAIVFSGSGDTFALVTLDMGAFLEESGTNILKLVQRKTGIGNILCVASHSHSSAGLQKDFPSERRPWIREVERRIADAIREAYKKLEPVQLGVGWGEVHEGHNRRKVDENGNVEMFWRNRDRLPTQPVDYQLGVIRVETLDGATLATLVNFACHPVILGPENLLLSADYPGVFTAHVEKALGGQCMFLQGAAGDINPFWDKTPPSEGAYEAMEMMGRVVGEEAIRVSRTIKEFWADPEISFKKEIIPLARRRDVARNKRELMAEINTVVIGSDLALATFPGEFFVEHGLALKRNSKIKNTMFVGYCNRRLRYFPTIKACTEGGYGAASATIVEVGAGERLVNRALINLYYQSGLISR